MNDPEGDEPIRLVFVLDSKSLAGIKGIQKDGNHDTMADTVKDALMIKRAIQTQAKEGFVQVILRNPKTGDERILPIPL